MQNEIFLRDNKGIHRIYTMQVGTVIVLSNVSLYDRENIKTTVPIVAKTVRLLSSFRKHVSFH